MGIDNILHPNFGQKPMLSGSKKPVPLNLDVRFGESKAAISCSNCKGLHQAGLFIILAGQAMLLCIKCIAGALMKFQETHPLEHLIEIDSNIPPETMSRAVEEIQKSHPEVPEKTVERIIREAINELGV